MTTIEIRTHTALHALKAAAVNVLAARCTAGVHAKGNHGRLPLHY
nr:alanyl-tRNA editing protein [Candidatus Bathyarchaeota archaeon]